jgi:hypothetical protein
LNENAARRDKQVGLHQVPHEDSKGYRDRRPRRQPRRLWGGGSCFNGLSYSKAVETDLEHTTGMKPEVGFNWHNGSFETVTVTFPQLYAGKPLEELARAVRQVVAKEFKQAPGTIVLAFTLKG